MSTESLDTGGSDVNTAESAEKTKRRAPPIPDILRHQHSFEQRYSSIIHKQIWETSINKEVMERQLNAYFPFARSASLQKEGQNIFDNLSATNSSKPEPDKPSPAAATTATSTSTATVEVNKTKCLDREETIDIAEKCQAEMK